MADSFRGAIPISLNPYNLKIPVSNILYPPLSLPTPLIMIIIIIIIIIVVVVVVVVVVVAVIIIIPDPPFPTPLTPFLFVSYPLL